MSKKYPLSNKLYDLLKANDPSLFRLGVGASAWLNKNKEIITNQIFQYNQCQQ